MNKAERFNSGSKTKKGKFMPVNKDKYVGDINDITYLSSWELRFMHYCDRTEEVLRWGSENFYIPYTMETKDKNGFRKVSNHRYFPDFYMEVKDESMPLGYKKIVVEVKPHHETIRPVAPKKFTTKSARNFEYAIKAYQKNMFKWNHALEYCKSRDMQFMIITEKHLGL